MPRGGRLVLDDGEDVLLADDQQLIAVDLELGPGVLGVEDLVALLDVDRLALAVVEDPARTDREDRALLGLLLGGVRQDDAALGHLFARGRLDHDAVAQRAKLGRGSGGGGQRAFLLGRRTIRRRSRWFRGSIGRADPAPGDVFSAATGSDPAAGRA